MAINVPFTKLVDLYDKVVGVTGGANGIGLAICHRLAEAGAFVFLADIDGAQTGKAIADNNPGKTV